MPRPGDVYAVPFPEGGRTSNDLVAPLVCLLRCNEDDDVYRGVIVLPARSEGAAPGEQQILCPSVHTQSQNVYVLFMDLSVPVDPATLAKRRVDFICGDTLIAAQMLARSQRTWGFDRLVRSNALDTDSPESDVEGAAFDANCGCHTMRKCEISDGETVVSFFTGRGLPCYHDEFGGNALDHARYVTSLTMREIGDWESAPDTEPTG